jgi:hypothetical protein
MLYYTSPPHLDSSHISRAARRIRSGVLRNFMLLAIPYTSGDVVWPMVNSICHGNVLGGNTVRVENL